MNAGKRSPIDAGLIVIVVLGLLYGLFESHRYFWDALIDCRYIEQPFDLRHMVHPGHPLFPLAFYRIFHMFGDDITWRSIHFFRAVSIIFSLAGLLTFHGIMKQVTQSRWASAISTLCLGLTAAWWQHSASGNVYIISTTFLLLSLYTYILGTKRGGSIILTLIHRIFFALSVLFCGFAIIFIVGFLGAEFIRRRAESGTGGAVAESVGHALITALFAIVPYVLMPVLFLGVGFPGEISPWLHDYDGAMPHFAGDVEASFRGTLRLGAESVTSLPMAAKVAFSGYEGAHFNATMGIYYLVFVAIAIGLGAGGLYAARRYGKMPAASTAFAAFSVVAIVVVGIYIIVVYPGSISHRLFLMPLVIGLIASWLGAVTSKWPRAIYILWLILPLVLFLNNWYVRFDRDRDAVNNPYISEAERVKQGIRPGDLLIDSKVREGIFRHAYFLYFDGIDSKHLFEIPGVMDRDRKTYRDFMTGYSASGRNIFIHEDAIQDEDAMQLLIRGMGADTNPVDLQAFVMDELLPISTFTINAKKYFVVVPTPFIEPESGE